MNSTTLEAGDGQAAAEAASDDYEYDPDCPPQALVGEAWFRAVLCCLYFVIFVLGVVGNVLVVLVSYKKSLFSKVFRRHKL